eukprot:CAMPEP_0203681546 /NCGR_PEP_ID=MMETSP0090-20130426/43036_1 /ASSEMBLY_ACC=CAM_ASM_001088 /TAXON_ID=426623 /ORGANISM="Chaetoceros affinis, Strain CCMP159" /LENGTH=418 /DNA_ID=CAMNT_0050550061 /DNA_START=93 /DNA_END=1345 /DNA_ORIENTATION=+
MVKINSNDVLLGRGGNSFRHSGNKKFRELANTLAKRYRDSSKLQKSEISKGMVRHVGNLDPPGRFLKKNTASERWEEVNVMIAREKASQCLRDAVAALNSSNKRHITSRPKHAPARKAANIDESEDYSYGDDLAMITKPPPLDFIEISDRSENMKLPSNPSSHHHDDTGLLVPLDVMIRGHQMNQHALRSQQKSNAKVTFKVPTKGEVRTRGEARLDDKFRTQAWGVRKEYRHHRTSAAHSNTRSNLHQDENKYLQNAYSNPFRSAPELQQRKDYPVTSSSFSGRKVLFASQRVDDQLKYSSTSSPSINKVSFDNPTSGGTKIPGRNSPSVASTEIKMEMDQDEFHSPDRSIFKNFFDDTGIDVNIASPYSPYSPYTSYSPDNKKLKKQRSFDDFNNLLKYCQSTSHSVDSIDSFAKS